jgi:hypothetical protein
MMPQKLGPAMGYYPNLGVRLLQRRKVMRSSISSVFSQVLT